MQLQQTITVRNIESQTYLDFKVWCLQHDVQIGSGISEAMKLWLESKKYKKNSLTIITDCECEQNRALALMSQSECSMK